MQIKLYQFNKRTNSTKKPNTTAYTYNGEIKWVCSAMSPAVAFDLPKSENMPRYNYCYIPAFGNRYYYISEWSWNLGLWIATLSIDVLATYKDDIYNYRGYVLRSSKMYNQYITDNKYPTTGDIVSKVNTLPAPWFTTMRGGAFVVGIVNNDYGAIGGVSYYEMSPRQFRSLMDYLLGDLAYMNITEISEDLQKAIIDPAKYIKSAMWFPLAINPNGENVSSVPVGHWNMPVSAARLIDYQTTREVNIAIPKHPQSYGADKRGNWLELAPYSAYTLEFFPWGSMPLDSNKLAGFDALNLSYIIDNITGVGTLRVIAGNSNGVGGYVWNDTMVYTSVAAVGVPVSMAQISLDFGNVGTQKATALAVGGESLVNAFAPDKVEEAEIGGTIKGHDPLSADWGSFDYTSDFGEFAKAQAMRAAHSAAESAKAGFNYVASRPVVQKIVSVAADIGRALAPGFVSCSVNGSNGSTACYSLALRLDCNFAIVANDDNEHNGRPLCSVQKLGDLANGFVLCQDGDLVTSATYSERDLISSYLRGGIYLE